MKKTIITIIAATIAAAFSATAQDKVTCDFGKAVQPFLLHLDMNGNSAFDEGEAVSASEDIKIYCSIKHKDFGTAGNINTISVLVKNGEGKGFSASAILNDIELVRSDEDGEESFCALDGFGKAIYFLTYDKDKEGWVLIITNIAMFEFTQI